MAFRTAATILKRAQLIARGMHMVVGLLAAIAICGLMRAAVAPSGNTALATGPAAVITTLLLFLAVCGTLFLSVSWVREHRVSKQRLSLLYANNLAEELVMATSPAELRAKLVEMMPQVSPGTEVRLYLYNRRSQRLECLGGSENQRPMSIDPGSPAQGIAAGIAMAFQSRAALNIPNTRRSPLLRSDVEAAAPQSVFLVPMLAQGELIGVLEATRTGRRVSFSSFECAALQHLANQAAIAVKLRERQARREQQWHDEKYAATGELIANLANELKGPLAKILVSAEQMAFFHQDPVLEQELRALTEEAERTSDLVARLASFGRRETGQPKNLEINGLLSSLMQLRDREWKDLGLELRSVLTRTPLCVNDPGNQLEQVFLNVFLFAEQCLVNSPEKVLSITTSQVGPRAVVDIVYGCAGDPSAHNGPGLGLWRTIVHSSGGETRSSRPSPATCRLEIEIPISDSIRSNGFSFTQSASRTLTMLVIEPDVLGRGRLVNQLSVRSHRAVPVISAEEGLDLAQRLRFDVVFCSTRLPGLSWPEFYERVHPLVGAFVILADEFEATPPEVMVLSKAHQDSDLDRLFAEAEASASSVPSHSV